MKSSKPRVKRTDPLEPLKMEIAAELGLLEQVKTNGWHSLNAKDAGKIGGLMTQRRKRENLQNINDKNE
ncbi:small, acid-soluble spore protein, alpha/beta type [Desulfosporosinus acidiphilus SJ4]|uniref:Small, acid-soluble spore protein, alpha/beta type n=1 Tax=Desulfosporosinus acidiphilus (strain DSM 22704 / JCM 16185 / SJ4) TaxID=646529 RepID=I4D4N0_DESAJ|nr:small, acid-soluble spore protein, alpha/beta type [Desulfosporosinus acidiphilus]AFM40754.1 small, acid-soluble spore protein, alpha/beta type [Desulfosporosinus acidiphilus SJ4]